MGLLKQWRKQNKFWQSINNSYVQLKRQVRIAKLPSKPYQQFQMMCENYTCARMSKQFDNIPDFAERPLNKYLHREWNGKQKLLTASHTLEQIEKTFTLEAIKEMFSTERQGLKVADIELKSGDYAQLRLVYSQYPREGDLTLHLLNEMGDDIYLMSFSFGTEGQLYICSLQGPSTEQSTEQVKSITKQMHGMRPKNLLMSSIYAVAAFFHCTSIMGISNNCHIKRQHLKSSYDHFWQECNGVISADGWYHLPLTEPVRDIESVKSQHRSAFRKREALREAMYQSVLGSLAAYSVSSNRNTKTLN
ncbi:VirK/YbjX family protein [Providencia vermicola]|uniref:DUF535 family protein n=3 Tax=Providencia TaxID=586 RepID=A0AAI9MV18_PROST|nr:MULTISPECIES: DUF535 family protein [Providencia]ELR5044168.1 DUF535 family protein [Providencia rettgeri]ELR5034434.1 DUF535 family protein [Providencia stuartii]ELR5120891.1 DUF535 family protein [Providencia stuartii]ELR5142486.1 DUF535 family protein [Providencia stuartii]ELR5291262.1 DUF535 family protein [Providencia stuartii]